MPFDEFKLKFPRFDATPLGQKMSQMEERGRRYSAIQAIAQEKMREDQADFLHEDAEFKSLQRAADAGVLTKTTRETDAAGRDATYIDTDHPRLTTARASRDRAEAKAKASRRHYEELRKTGCGDAALLRRLIGYLASTPAARKAVYAAHGV
jgi:hypothetical protein